MPEEKLTEEQKQEGREAMARCLESLAADIRTGKVEVSRMDQSIPYRRFWADQRWEYFKLLDMQIRLNYYDVEQRKAEQERLEKYLVENPGAESYGDGGPLGKEVLEVKPIETLDRAIPAKDHLLVYLNDQLQGCVIEADVTEGYVVKRTWEGDIITLKGEVKIIFNGEPVVRAEVDEVFRARISKLKEGPDKPL